MIVSSVSADEESAGGTHLCGEERGGGGGGGERPGSDAQFRRGESEEDLWRDLYERKASRRG